MKRLVANTQDRVQNILTILLLLSGYLLLWNLSRSATLSNLQLTFRSQSNGSPLVFDQLSITNAAGQALSVTRLDLLLSNFSFRRPNGTWIVQTNTQAFISPRENRSSLDLKNIPAGNYNRVRFQIGLPPALNHSNPAQYPADHPLNPNLNGMHWGWSGGYVFFAMEGHWLAADEKLNGYSFHLGNDPMLTTVELPLTLNLPQTDTISFILNLDHLLPTGLNANDSTTHSRPGDKLAIKLQDRLRHAFSVTTTNLKSVHISTSPHLPVNTPKKPKVSKGVTPYRFTISSQFPIPDLPKDNPLTEEGVELGQRLFHEPLLSINNQQSCASCHQSQAAFADPGKQFSLGAEGHTGTRNAMPLFNLAWKKSFFWDGRAASLREQVLMPIQNPIEMHESLTNAVAKLQRSTNYPALFKRAFGSSEITAEALARALEQFLLTQVSFTSRFDDALEGKESLTDEEKRGFELFITEYDPRRGQFGADCFHCHGGPFFTTHGFVNNGLDSISSDLGRFDASHQATDKGKFAVPSLRNVEVTGPYMHDGRFKTLEEVVEHYATGVKRNSALDPNLAKHPDGGVPLSASDKKALVAFLKTLTDKSLVRSPRNQLAGD